MTHKEAVQQINKKIIEWSKERPKLVVAIDGYTGIGKTTILNELEKINPAIVAVHQDDFIFSRSVIEQLLAQATDRSVVFELRDRDSAKIEHLVDLFRSSKGGYVTSVFNPDTGEIDTEKNFDLSKNIFVIEGVCMFHPQSLDHLWDKRIYLDGDIPRINERRIQREKEKWGKDYFPEDHPDSFFRQVIIALNRYREKFQPEKTADLVVRVD